ncbi:MAG TPA: nucleoside diphosphate kinase regulator [Thermoanaerobaculia bacterium]|nr:nucleoside diphosphate kinase regulator [Thermoanaerobaculia bacterium]
MTERAIYLTSQDRDRLQALTRMTGDKDRGDLADLLYELSRAVVVPAAEIPADVITMNSRVRLLDLQSGATLEYTLVYPGEANFSEGKISVVAPIGAAMIGYRVGDTIEWEVPAGRRHFRVEAVLYQPEAAGDNHL